METSRYSREPKVIGYHTTEVQELMFYQDMLIKFPFTGQPNDYDFESRLLPFKVLIHAAIEDFKRDFGLIEYDKRYIYISAKNLFQNGVSYNRGGWHCDGFGSSDINYIWSNEQPTVFNTSNFKLSNDDGLSMQEMSEQAHPKNDIVYANNTLLRLDQYNVHKTNPKPYTGVRAFLKVSFSRDKFDLIGNAINPLFNYNWQMRPRGQVRNIPQSEQSK